MSLNKIFVNNQDTGFDGIIEQQTGESATRSMSQKAVTDELNILDSYTPNSLNDDSQASLNIGDEQGNVIVEFKDGHLKTKKFNSRTVKNPPSVTDDDSQASLNIGDNNGNVLVEFKDGHLKTKKFNSKTILNSKDDDSQANLNIGDN